MKLNVDGEIVVAARLPPMPSICLSVTVHECYANVSAGIGGRKIGGNGGFTASAFVVHDQNVEVCHIDPFQRRRGLTPRNWTVLKKIGQAI
jgi:hypothetical protein